MTHINSVSGNSTRVSSHAQNHNGDNAPDNVSRCYALLCDAHVPRNLTTFTMPFHCIHFAFRPDAGALRPNVEYTTNEQSEKGMLPQWNWNIRSTGVCDDNDNRPCRWGIILLEWNIYKQNHCICLFVLPAAPWHIHILHKFNYYYYSAAAAAEFLFHGMRLCCWSQLALFSTQYLTVILQHVRCKPLYSFIDPLNAPTILIFRIPLSRAPLFR